MYLLSQKLRNFRESPSLAILIHTACAFVPRATAAFRSVCTTTRRSARARAARNVVASKEISHCTYKGAPQHITSCKNFHAFSTLCARGISLSRASATKEPLRDFLGAARPLCENERRGGGERGAPSLSPQENTA